jgi:hypothetical protein
MSTPPAPDEASKRSVGSVYQFPVVSPLLSTFGVISANATFRNEISARLGSFLAAIVHGKNGIPAAELLADENLLKRAVSNMYGRYMAQVMARKMRVAAGEQRFRAVVQQPTSRLVQNRGAKIGLQVLLGVMVVCGLVAWGAMWNVGILPHCPCSIAGTACLLGGQEFWGGRRDWGEDEGVFELVERDGRVGIYAKGDDGGRFVK